MLIPKRKIILLSLFILLSIGCKQKIEQKIKQNIEPQLTWIILEEKDLSNGAHHTNHFETFGKYVTNFNNQVNSLILRGIDSVQSKALDGGGYFTGIRALPTESPVYYNLKLFNKPLIEVPRNSSYCSGASYSAFIEALNLLYPEKGKDLAYERYESLRMQELDGGRREDLIKFWGHWNADGFGNHFALVQYSGMGEVISPEQAWPGDFVNISWKSGLGHSVIFLGWTEIKGDKKIVYWSSQTATNGYGDQIVSLEKIKSVKVVRLTKPENLFIFNPENTVNLNIAGDKVN